MPDDRVLATVLFTDIVDSTRRAEIGDRDWRALLDAHDAVVRAQLVRFRGREVNTSGDGFLAMFDGPQRAIRCAMAIRDAVQSSALNCAPGCTPASARSAAMTSVGLPCTSARVSAWPGQTTCSCPATARPRDRIRARVRRPRRSPAQGRARRVASLRRRRNMRSETGIDVDSSTDRPVIDDLRCAAMQLAVVNW